MPDQRSDERLSVLARTALFEGLGPEALRGVASAATEVSLPAGSLLMRAGEAADALYVVVRGRLVVVDELEDDEDRALDELGPGTVIGEVALLAGGARSATVRVAEDANLLRLSRQQFERLVQEEPTVLARASELVSRRLRGSQLAEWSGWTERCGRQADHVLVVALAGSPADPEEIERQLDVLRERGPAPRMSLVLLYPDADSRPLATALWRDLRRVDRHYHVRLGSSADFMRLARMLSGRAIGLVLGGGGARGFAHIGVLRALEELGIPIDIVGGASMGSLIAACFAMGLSPQEIQQRCREHGISVFDPTLPLVSLLVGRKIRRGLTAVFGDRQIEDLWIPCFAVSTKLTRAETMVHDRGALAAAVRSSVSMPGIMPPVFYGGDLLVDGGLLNNLPIDVMNSMSEGGRIITVDVSPDVDLALRQAFASELSGWRLLWSRLNPWAKTMEVPAIHSILVRATLLASVKARASKLADTVPSLYLQPAVDRWGLLDFKSLDDVAQAGYDSCIDAIRTWWSQENSRRPG